MQAMLTAHLGWNLERCVNQHACHAQNECAEWSIVWPTARFFGKTLTCQSCQQMALLQHCMISATAAWQVPPAHTAEAAASAPCPEHLGSSRISLHAANE